MTASAGVGRVRLASPQTWAWLLGGLLALSFAAVLPLGLLARTSFGITPLLIGLPTAAVGVIVARRQPRNPLGWLLVAIAGCEIVSTDGGLYSILDYRRHVGGLPLGPVAVLLYELWIPGLALLGLVILLFPDGRLPSRRWRWALGAYLVLYALLVIAIAAAAAGAMIGHPIRVDATGGLPATDNATGWFGAAQSVLATAMVALWLSFIGRQVLSWRRADGDRRQQLKWLMFGAAIAVACALLVPAANSAGFWGVAGNTSWFGFAALPVAIGVAILKYRLYEIDRIISRTLAYAIVTGLLVGVYAGLVLLATRVLPFSSSVAVAASTLAAAALFNPLRRQVQHMVDRRFNRARYDADKTVAAFAARLQDAVDLDAVQDDLADVVHQALEPAHVSVWISQRG